METRTVDIHIAKLRRKIEADPAKPRYLVTVRGAGYRLLAE
jgi:two-component system response regulator RegX3